MLYFWKLHDLKTAGWLAALLLAFAAALRLARFNIMIDGPERPAWQKAYAVGVPAPAGAMLAIFPITLSLAGLPDFPGFPVLILLWTLACAALMVSRLPSFSGKGLRTPISRNYVIAVLLLVVLTLMVLVSHPFETLSALTLVYLIGLPVAVNRFLTQKAQESLRVQESLGAQESPADPGASPENKPL
jgi:CDP-diacylglycerol---serine O-phosphatidyltransferase